MHALQRTAARTIAILTCLLPLPAVAGAQVALAATAPLLAGASAPLDTVSRMPVAAARPDGAVSVDSVTLAESTVFADSVALADSVRLVTQLLTANGAPAERAAPAAAAIMKYARLHRLDPLLVVGIIGVENAALVPRARSRVGATGVMQVMPLWKRYITDCGDDLRRIEVNVCFGTRILRIALDETTSVRQALLRYNGCVRSPGCHAYPTSVFSWVGRALVLARAPDEAAGASGGRVSVARAARQ
jgi:soluble lytic murein transglycosylase-like protein